MKDKQQFDIDVILQLNTMLKNTIRQSQDEQNGTANVRLGIVKKVFLV